MFIQILVPVDGQDMRQVASALWALYTANVVQMRPDYPSVYAFARYQREPLGREHWQTADELRRTRVGDCEDLAAYAAVWYRVTGVDPQARIALKRSSVGYHVVVRRGDGTLEDPSAVLGMYDE